MRKTKLTLFVIMAALMTSDSLWLLRTGLVVAKKRHLLGTKLGRISLFLCVPSPFSL